MRLVPLFLSVSLACIGQALEASTMAPTTGAPTTGFPSSTTPAPEKGFFATAFDVIDSGLKKLFGFHEETPVTATPVSSAAVVSDGSHLIKVLSSTTDKTIKLLGGPDPTAPTNPAPTAKESATTMKH